MAVGDVDVPDVHMGVDAGDVVGEADEIGRPEREFAEEAVGGKPREGGGADHGAGSDVVRTKASIAAPTAAVWASRSSDFGGTT